jgi:hypothetical protein
MFQNAIATSFDQNTSSWNTSNVNNMRCMFENTRRSSWDTSNVQDMYRMFENTARFNVMFLFLVATHKLLITIVVVQAQLEICM